MMKILCIDDNELIRKLFRFLLQSSGYQVFEAENGARGIQVCRAVLPDLILMDVQMPVMDGITALKLILSLDATKHIPVIATTSYAMKGDRERFLDEGFAGYLSKPFDNDYLLLCIKKFLKRPPGLLEEKWVAMPLDKPACLWLSASEQRNLQMPLHLPEEKTPALRVLKGIK
jgi:two-component system, cell cycle response regulator DivK